MAAIFLGPPLWFDEVKTGYLYTGAFIGSIIGLFLSGLLSDSLNRVMIKLNKGRYEPEFRILLVIFQLVFCGAGLYGFGIVSEDVARYGWLVADVFFALVVIGMVLGAVASALYIVDAHREFYRKERDPSLSSANTEPYLQAKSPSSRSLACSSSRTCSALF